MKPNQYLSRLFELDFLTKEGGLALDVGCGDGRDSKFLTENGYDVVSVDKEPLFPGAVVTDIRDFYIEPNKYSFITCNHILPFLDNQIEVLETVLKLVSGLKKGGLMHFTLFGKNSEIRVPTHFTFNEIEAFISAVPCEVIEKSTREGPGTSMRGKAVHAHIHTLLVKKS